MESKAFERASAECAAAHRKLEEMKQAKDIHSLAAQWSEFLVLVQRVFTKMTIATKGDTDAKHWFLEILDIQQNDPLLKYIKTARDFDEHGIDRIVDKRPSRLDFKAKPGRTEVYIDHLSVRGNAITLGPEASKNLSIDFSPGAVELVDVRERGVSYRPPDTHLGKTIAAATPITVAELTCAFLARMLADARQQYG